MVKIYYVKQNYKLTRAAHGRPPLFINDSIFDIKEEDYIPCDRRGENLDVSNKFNGDFSKIKDVHFLKGTYFDRDYFRRLYPNINVRIKPELADIIIYDEKSIFENDIVPRYYTFLKEKSSGDILYFNSDSILNNICECIGNPHSYSRNIYGQLILADGSIIKKFVDNKNEISGCYLGIKNEYYETLNKLKKPYLSTTDAINKIPSTLKQNTLPIEECFSYFNQIRSCDAQAMRTAMESIIMYNTEKYLPLQVLFYSYYINTQTTTKTSGNLIKPSNKINLFYEANKNFVIGPHIIENALSVLSHFSNLCSNHFTKICPNADWQLIRKFLLSKEFYDAASSTNKYNGLKIHGVAIEFMSPPLAGPIEQVIENKSIAEFIL